MEAGQSAKTDGTFGASVRFPEAISTEVRLSRANFFWHTKFTAEEMKLEFSRSFVVVRKVNGAVVSVKGATITLGAGKMVSDTGSSEGEGFITRPQIWNWQHNCNRTVTVHQWELTKAINLEIGLEGGNPTWPQVDATTYGHLNGRDAIVLTYYNGMFGGELKIVKTTNGRSLSCWEPIGTTKRILSFLQNINDYVQHVNSHIE